MLARLSTLLMAVFIFSTQVHASSQTGLKAAFDELKYSLTVEWDQKDAAFYTARTTEFKAAIKTAGLSNAQLVSFIKSQSQDAAFSSDVDAAVKLVSNKELSVDEASELLLGSLNRSYAQGASWSGMTNAYVASAALVVVFAAIFIAVPTHNHEICTTSYDGTYCR